MDRLRQILNNLLGQRAAPRPPAAPSDRCAGPTRCPSLWRTTARASPEDFRHIFERFYRADPSRPGATASSLGLGLTIVKALVEMQGGDVGVESASEGPATFWFTLPRYTP
ncbi:MAG: HAMP domain-containing sensor histidine kinase [Caldilineaceae bacterium]